MPDGDGGGRSERCSWCGEPLLRQERARFNCMHEECGARGVFGSVAHLEKRCCCYVPGSTEEDPPGMTRREAARAAYALWLKQQSAQR